MKTMRPYFLTLLLSLTLFPLLANGPLNYPNEPDEKDFVRYLKEGKFVIQKYIGNAASLTVPSHFNNIEVSAIEKEAFYDNTTLTHVTLPAGIQKIGDNAFRLCDMLESVTFQSSKLTIGTAAFSECNKLKEVTLPLGTDTVGNYAFANCKQLSKVTVLDKEVVFLHKADSCNIFCKEKGIVDNVFIGYDGSTTETLAEQMNYSFSLITDNATTTRIESNKSNLLKIFPSIIDKRYNTSLNIKTNNLGQDGELSIYRLSGEIILKQKIQLDEVTINLDKASIGKGLYIVILSSVKGKQTNKFIVR